VEDIIAIIFIFGGLTTVGISFSPLGRAIADRIRFGKTAPELEVDHALYDEVDRIRLEMEEVRERLDFNERLLASARDGSAAAPAAGEPADG
jgi:hypothetical protein